MIRAEQIPDEVVEAAAIAIAFTAEPIHKWRYHIPEARAAIAAAINAWPGVDCRPTFGPSRIILPLPQDKVND